MHQHPDLLIFDPNFIIHLLHTNVNYNYFWFANHTFQQVKGTAMGAAFSPTIANIFMSKLINNFLKAQHTQLLLLKRYIDDILIWKDTMDNLLTFLTTLNAYTSALIAHSGLLRPHYLQRKTFNSYQFPRYKNIPKTPQLVPIPTLLIPPSNQHLQINNSRRGHKICTYEHT